MSKFHAIVLHNRFPTGQEIQHHTKHRTLASAARSLSKGITAARLPGPGWVTWCAVVTPEGAVMSLRQAQGKMDHMETYPALQVGMRAAAGIKG